MAVAPCSLGIARTWPSNTTCFVRWSYNGGTEVVDWATACHELGHVLGLGHNNAKPSCMYKEDAAGVSKYPHAVDRKLLERYY